MSAEDEPQDPIDESMTIDSGRMAATPGATGSLGEIGGYRLLGKLGEGGMGIVYEAEQQNPRRRVALKVIRGGRFVDESYLRMFRRETETLARLAHPNIAGIYEAGRTEGGQHYFTMELVSGRTLSAFVKERLGGEKPTPAQLRERLALFATICRAVNYAHQRGVIHRDLKPTNLFITDAGDAKILDFGLARITDADVVATSVMTEVGVIQGTLAYMSPEQARGKSNEIDLRTDVYSLGVILYELISNGKPHDLAGVSVVTAIQRICEETARPMKTTAAGVAIDPDLQTITAKALEKEPDRRYQSAGALAEDVERFLADEPILAHPPSTRYQIRKYVARHTARVAALGAIVMLVVALAATMVVQAARVRRERDRAQAEAAKSAAIDRFLLDTLGSADPWGLGARNVTLLQALEQARAKAHTAFASEPLVEASVLQSLGTTLSSLAEFAVADSVLQTAYDLRVAAAGARSPEAATSLAALASHDLKWGRYDEAEKRAREALGIARERYGATSLETAAITVDLATALGKQGKRDEARSLAEQVLQLTRTGQVAHRDETREAQDPRLVESNALETLTQVTMDAGDYKAMEKYASERLAIVRSRTSGPSADLGLSLNDFATAQLMNGDLAGAEKGYDEAIETARTVFGADHPEVALYLENVGNVYYQRKRLDKTAYCLETVLAMRRRALGDDSEPVARTLANMAVVYTQLDSLEAAERTYREAVDRLTKKLGPDHPDVGITLAGQGSVLRRQKKYAEAEPILLRALTVQKKANGETHPWTQRTLDMLATLYTEWGKPAQAAEYKARIVAKK